VGFSILIKRFKFKLKPCLDRTILKETAHFSLANYIVSYLNGFPALLLPIIITNLIGAKENAVYYIAYSISSLLFLIPLAVANSIFAEGSSSIETLGDTIKRASKILLIVMLPAIALMILFAPLILSFFGKQYSIQGIAILRILSLSGLFIAVCYPCGSILNILHKLRYLIFANFLGALSVILIVISFIKHGYGLVGVAWGWLIGWGLYTIIYLIFTGKALLSRNEKTHQVTS
jgi:O-antigen/teichoic acid export membrane protein